LCIEPNFFGYCFVRGCVKKEKKEKKKAKEAAKASENN
jgi:hypothetical protein